MQKNEVVSDIDCVAHLTQCFAETSRVFKFKILKVQVGLPAHPVRLFNPVNLFLQNGGVFAADYDHLGHAISREKFELEKNQGNVCEREEALCTNV